MAEELLIVGRFWFQFTSNQQNSSFFTPLDFTQGVCICVSFEKRDYGLISMMTKTPDIPATVLVSQRE